jgi:hypothetical protein
VLLLRHRRRLLHQWSLLIRHRSLLLRHRSLLLYTSAVCLPVPHDTGKPSGLLGANHDAMKCLSTVMLVCADTTTAGALLGWPRKLTRRQHVARGGKAKRLRVDGMGGNNLRKDLHTTLSRPTVCDREKKRDGPE